MLLGTNETTRKIDSYAINSLKIPGIVLMENAAISFVRNIDLSLDNYLVICGKGNNGGDGYAIARQLHSLEKNVEVFCTGEKNMSRDCQTNYSICRESGIKIHYDSLERLLLNADCIIDSIFGTGLDSEIRDEYREIIEKINSCSKNRTVYAVDMPSGINGSDGSIMGAAVRADRTVTFMTYKTGFLNSAISDYLGEIIVANIGLNEESFADLVTDRYLTEKDIRSWKVDRKANSHKGDFGKVLIFAGSEGFSGASVITTNACVRTGSGLVTLLSHEATLKAIGGEILEGMTLDADSQNILEIENRIKNSDVIAIGPGIGKTKKSLKIMKKLLSYEKNANGETIKLVIDADGLNLLSENRDLFANIRGRAVLTPHLAEFSRLCGLDTAAILENRLGAAKKFALENEIVLLLKGKNTLITDGKNLFVNSTGNPGMASGGMGDCLTGIIASLAGQKYGLVKSASIGAFLHGYIADRLSEKQYTVNASHVIENIPVCMKEIFQ